MGVMMTMMIRVRALFDSFAASSSSDPSPLGVLGGENGRVQGCDHPNQEVYDQSAPLPEAIRRFLKSLHSIFLPMSAQESYFVMLS